MRKTIMGTTLSGALALSFLALPAAQADSGDLGDKRDSRIAAFKADRGVSTLGEGDLTINSVTINRGKDVIVGTTKAIVFPVSMSITNPEGVDEVYADLWHGSTVENLDGYLDPDGETADCTAVDATTTNCTFTITADPQYDLYKNTLAGGWHVTAGALGTDGDTFWDDFYDSHSVKRASRISINASPEPVSKGRTITGAGVLTRANWESSNYRMYLNQKVKLQFRKAGTSRYAYSNIKTLYSNTSGLRASTTAVTDGYWRFGYAGSSTTQPAFAKPDYIDVR